MRRNDSLKQRILEVVTQANEPLETAEILSIVGSTRVKVLYRLNMLRGETRIKGKAVGSGKGTWIWW